MAANRPTAASIRASFFVTTAALAVCLPAIAFGPGATAEDRSARPAAPLARIAQAETPTEDAAPVERVTGDDLPAAVDRLRTDPAPPGEAEPVPTVDVTEGTGATPPALLHVPIVTVYPGDVRPRPTITSPVADDPEAVYRGMNYFNQFNCIGCHAPNGSGGMGPSLSNSSFLYGGEPENIYLTILQGRPAGMPVFGGLLPDQVIWDLVAYVRSISREPSGPWGRTTKPDGFTIEQVPAQYISTVDPWSRTQPFSYGQPPFEKIDEDPYQ
jgi:cytochrome c oxidase cbb3-type subunit III